MTASPFSSRPLPSPAWSLRRWAVNDWVVLGYLLFLVSSVLTSDVRGPARTAGLKQLSLLLAGFLLFVPVLVRAELLKSPLLTALSYRVGHLGALVGSYSLMRGFLPVVDPGHIDRELHALGLAAFGLEPAIAWQSWISPGVTEWFAFFYYSYFLLLALHTLPLLFVATNPRIVSEFALGLTLVVAVAQALYLVVPGFGPVVGATEVLNHPLPSGIWWDRVLAIVQSAGAQKDIFPSVHTAAPSFILLFSYRNRRHAPYRYTWPVLAFFVGNIVLATMYLRWHWLVDVVAGMALAFFAHVASVYISVEETALRKRLRVGPVWPPWPPPWSQVRPAKSDVE